MPITAQEFYEGLADAQSYVVNEISFLETISAYQFLQKSTSENDFLSKSFEMKHYFTTQLLLCESFPRLNAAFPKFYSSFVRSDIPRAPLNSLVPPSDLDDLIANVYLEAQPDRLLVDVLTFSVVPSRFQFFLLQPQIVIFCSLVEKLRPHNKHFSLLRVVFLTPHFLTFIRRTIFPILEDLLDEGNSVLTNPSAFLSDVFNAWKINLQFCPTYIHQVLGGDRPQAVAILENCFWNPFIRFPSGFLACRFHKLVPTGFLEPIRAELKAWGDRFAELLTDETATFYPFMSKTDVESDARVFSPMVWDSIDKRAFAHFSRPGEFQLPLADFEIFQQSSDSTYSIQPPPPTRPGTVLAEYYLRQLLKAAPLLPLNPDLSKLKTGDYRIQIVNEYLVKTCSKAVRPQQEYLFSQFEKNLNARGGNLSTEPVKFREMIQRMKTRHDSQFESIVASAEVARRLKSVLSFDDASEEIGQLAYRVRIDDLAPAIQGAIQMPPKDEMIRDPTIFRTAFRKRLELFQGENDPLSNVPEHSWRLHTHFHIASRDLTFRRFLAYNPQFTGIDSMFARAAQRGGRTVPNEEVDLCVMRNLRLFDGIGLQLAHAFSGDGDALTKFEAIKSAFQAAADLFKTSLGDDSEDQNLVMRVALIRHVHPPRLFSSMAFIHEFFAEVPIISFSSQKWLFLMSSPFLLIVNEIGFGRWKALSSYQIRGCQLVLSSVTLRLPILQCLTRAEITKDDPVTVVVPFAEQAILLEAPLLIGDIKKQDVRVAIFCSEIATAEKGLFRRRYQEVRDFFEGFPKLSTRIILCSATMANSLEGEFPGAKCVQLEVDTADVRERMRANIFTIITQTFQA
jgi:hypothetical protein